MAVFAVKNPYWDIEERTARIAPALRVDRLLALCARGDVRSELSEAIVRAAKSYRHRDDFATVAEGHGIGPLAQMQLEVSNPSVPIAVRRALVGTKMRHARKSAIRASLLAEMHHALITRGVPMLVLKGGALAFSVYEKPELRSMRDLDVPRATHAGPRRRAHSQRLRYGGAPGLSGRVRCYTRHVRDVFWF